MEKYKGTSKVFELVILTATLVAAILIGINQNSINEAIYQTTDKQTEINEQLRDLNFLVNLQPVLTASYNPSSSIISSTITFSNFGKLPIFIDTTRTVRIDSSKATDSCNIHGVDRTIPAGESASFEILDNYLSITQSLVAGDFLVPFSYQIFFQVLGVPQIYIGEVVLFFDKDGNDFRFSKSNSNIPPGVYLQKTNYTDFHKLYEEKLCPQK